MSLTGQLLLSGTFSGRQVLLGMAGSATAGGLCRAPVQSITAAGAAILRRDLHHPGKAERLLVRGMTHGSWWREVIGQEFREDNTALHP
jgi:hypothetical protein